MTSADAVLTQRIALDNDGCMGEALLITLNRPTKRNCFDTRVCTDLANIFHDVANEIEGYDAHDGPVDSDDDDDGIQNGDENDSRRIKRPLHRSRKNRLVAVIFTGSGESSTESDTSI